MYRPYPPRWITKKNDSFRLETHCSSPSSSTHSAPAAGFSISAWPWRATEGRISFFRKRTQKWLTGVNPRSRLIRFSKNSSFHYFTVDEMGLRLMKLALDEMALYRFQRYLQQNGICKASMLPLYLFSLELLSEAYALKKGKQMRAELDRGALFSCQADVVKRICNTGPNLITIPDKWLLDLDTERDDSSDELLLSPNATFLSQQSGM